MDVPDALVWPGLVLLGVLVGGYGSLIGAGGGFLLVPALLVLYPEDSPELVTSVSLAVVCISAASGSVAYLRQRRVDLRAGNVFAVATLPGAVAGALAVGRLPRDAFDLAFAALMLAVAAWLVLRPGPSSRMVPRFNRSGEETRMLTDAHGDTYFYSYNRRLGAALSACGGFVSSLLGIGGGVIQVPAMVQILRFPAHIATATSQYVLVWTALAGTMVHLASGDLASGYGRVAALGAGVVVGSQAGAWLSTRLRGAMLVRLLAAAMAVIALRLLLASLL